MPGPTFYNLRLLCYIDDTDFTDYQGIGSDPMYKRFESVQSVVKNNIEENYQSFLARPYYDDGNIHWYVNEWNETPKCFTELNESESSKYKKIKNDTIKHYNQVLTKLNAEEYAILSGALKYIEDEFLYCYDNKVVLIAWGMRPDTSKHIISGSWVKGFKNNEKYKITFDVGQNGKLKNPIYRVIKREKGYKLTSTDIPEVLENNNYAFDGWFPSPQNHVVNDDLTFTASYSTIQEPLIESNDTNEHSKENIKIIFDAGTIGTLNGVNIIEVPKGHCLSSDEVPNIIPNNGYRFIKWNPSILQSLETDTFFIAEYAQDMVNCFFDAGEHGKIQGENRYQKLLGDTLLANEIPLVKSQKGYKFIGWDKSPYDALNSDRRFIAKYEKNIPWYKRWWLMLTGSGCLKWLLWTILFLLIIWLLSFLFRGCTGCTRHHDGDRFGQPIFSDDSVSQLEPIRDSNGNEYENNGAIESIVDKDGDLPDNNVISPIVEDGGVQPPIVHNEGVPDVVGNRLNIYFDNENADLNKWAHDFKNVYPSDNYRIIGYDKNVRMIQIQIPENQRNIVRNEINRKIPDQDFFVVDESIITLHGNYSQSNSGTVKGWHLKALNIKQAWSISKGSPNVVIAIVDDGFDVNHKMLKGRFFKAYNIFTQNRTLGIGQGHGTHVAGLAAGSANYYSNGAAGMAPQCKIMPIQVFDNGMCTFSSIASGIMYAIHNGANIVNISIGPSFQGLDQMPLPEQQKIAETYFKNEERVYQHIIKTANEKNVILVFAAGNDNIMTAILPECREVNRTVNVAAATPNYKAAEFTNYSIGTNISAPGVNINSAFPNNSYKMLDGTSMAAPIVSGTIALMRSINSKLTVSQVIGVMQQTGRKIDEDIPPMVEIFQALTAVRNGKIPNSPVSSTSQEKRDKRSNMKEHTLPNNTEQSDNYNALKSMLEQLKAKRAALDEKINQIEQKLK